jgi:hypothetical protein
MRANFLAAKREIEALQTVKIQNGDPYDMQFALLRHPLLAGYAEAVTQLNIAAGESVTLSMQDGNVAKLILTRNVVSLVFSGVPASDLATTVMLIVEQDSAGNHTLKWPSSVKWANGAAPGVSTSPNAIDIYALITIDGGVTWYGFVGGQACE